MDKKPNKEKLAKEICDAAHLYKENLVGKNFLYVFDSRYIEVLYKSKKFQAFDWNREQYFSFRFL